MNTKKITLSELPFPPSENQLYYTVPGKGFRAISKEGRLFISMMNIWAARNRNQIETAKRLFENRLLHAEVILFRPRESIFTKLGKPKRWDATNRLKILIDQVSKIINVDDSYFFKVGVRKCCTTSREYVEIQLSEIESGISKP